MRSVKIPGLTVALIAASQAPGFASVPAMMNHQGRLTRPDLKPADGTHRMRFRLFATAAEEKPLWSEPPEGQPERPVVVQNGLYNVLLGGYDPYNNPMPASAFTGSTWIETVVDGEVMKPRIQILSVGYAMRSGVADSLALPFEGATSSAQPAISIANKGGDAGQFLGNVSVDGSVRVDSGRANLGTGQPGLRFGQSSTGESISSNRSDTDPGHWGLDFYTNNTHRLTISNSGNVGIGTRTPAAKLQVDNGSLRLRNTSDNKNYEIAYDAAGDYLYVDEFGAGRHFVVKNGGNVGIGTTDPQARLDVRGMARIMNVDANAVSGESWGTGAGIYGWGNAAGPAVYGLQLGGGRAGSFIVNNTANESHALYAKTNGRGYAGYFDGSVLVTGNISVPDLYVWNSMYNSSIRTDSLDLQNGTLRITAANSIVDISANGQVRITSPGQIDINAGTNLNLTAGGSMKLSAGGNLTLKASGSTFVQGATVNLN